MKTIVRNEESLGDFYDALRGLSPVELDIMWAILKYKGMGIFKKVKCFAYILDIDEQAFIDGLPKDESGRVLDYETRHLIHDALLNL